MAFGVLVRTFLTPAVIRDNTKWLRKANSGYSPESSGEVCEPPKKFRTKNGKMDELFLLIVIYRVELTIKEKEQVA